VKENLNNLRETIETSKIEKGIDFLVETERATHIRKVKRYWGETGVNILSNLSRRIHGLSAKKIVFRSPVKSVADHNI
jgi:hypothetical protein